MRVWFKSAWADGTTAKVMSGEDFVVRMAAIIPMPRCLVFRYHRVFAPNASLRCTTAANSAPCPDGDKCTTGETCSGGKCVLQSVSCDDQNVCTTDTCSAQVGCASAPVANATPCGTGKPCVGGKCLSTAKPDGCAPGIGYAMKIEGDLWLCAIDNIKGNNNYAQVYSACTEAGGFHMGTVSSMTRRGLPANSNIGPAMTWAASKGYDYVVTGQPTRAFSWSYAKTPYETTSCGGGGLGYIHTGETTGAGDNWKSLVDGNDAEYRSWPAANCVEVAYHTLIALCQDASNDPKAYVFDHRWR